MSLRRNQLKKMGLEQIVALLQTETDSDNIKLIASFLNDKNQQLIDKKATLLDQLQVLRSKIDKSVHGLNVVEVRSRAESRTESTRRRRL